MTTRHRQDSVLLHSKLNRPGVTRNLIVRSHLLKLLNNGLEGAITLVVAPAGFGKTTLVSSWLQTLSDKDGVPIPAAWLSLDESDSELEVFLRYFIAALRTIFSDACSETLNLLNARQEPPPGLLSDMLSNELELLPSRFVIVLDDLNTLGEQGVMDCLNDWMRHWPRQMYLVILSRFNPPLPLGALRAKGLLTEIRAHDLRFSPAETVEYFQQILETPLDEASLSLLDKRLEGWIAGLKIASLSLGARDDSRALSSVLSDGDVYINDYLRDQVFNAQPPAIQHFLLTTSIVDRFCAPLCEALIHPDNPDCNVRAQLDYLEATELFLNPLDNRREWYHFHQIFRDMLRQRLSGVMAVEQIKALHRRTADWFAAHDLLDQAIHHALEAGDLEMAARFMQQGLCDVLNREDRPTLERWLRLMPKHFIEQSPELLVMSAFVHGFRWELDLIFRVVEKAEALLDESDGSDSTQTLKGLIAILKGQDFYQNNQPARALPFCQDGLSILSEEWHYARGIAGIYKGVSLYATGYASDAEKYLSTEYESTIDKTNGFALRLLLGLAINSIQAGYYENAERTAQTLLLHAIRGRLSVMEGWGHYLIGFVNYEWNKLDVASRHFTRVVDLFYITQLATTRNGMIGQALTSQALGWSADALESIDQLSRFDLGYQGREAADTASARARLRLMQGDWEGAERGADHFSATTVNQSLTPWMERPLLTKVRILIARNKDGDVQSALQLLDAFSEITQRTFNVRICIEILALRALAQLTRGDSAAARETLIRSVELARHGAFTRTYLDLGPQMEKLMAQIAGHGPTSKTVGRILAAFPASEPTRAPANLLTNQSAVSQPYSPDDDLNESLTPRELQVLVLMAEPISLKVIAARLNISYATARRYTINVYSKLGVHNRWGAVDTAVRKGIISSR